MTNRLGRHWIVDKECFRFAYRTDKDVSYGKDNGTAAGTAEPTRRQHKCGGDVWGVGDWLMCAKCAAEVRS
jgi:hypothetical protein